MSKNHKSKIDGDRLNNNAPNWYKLQSIDRQTRYLAIEVTLLLVAIIASISPAIAAEENLFFRCNFYYRSNQAGSKVKPIQKSIDLVPNRRETFTINEFNISVGYSDFDPHETSAMGVSVGTKDNKIATHSVLYQFSSIADIKHDFVGKLGFTGLHFVNIPNSDRELQYSCSIESKNKVRQNTGF